PVGRLRAGPGAALRQRRVRRLVRHRARGAPGPHHRPGEPLADAPLAGGPVTRRLVVLLAAVGLILLAAAVRELSVRWRRRPPRPAEAARYSGVPASAEYSSALALGALASLRAGEVLDAVPCRRPRRAIRRELRAAAEPYRRSVLGEEDISTAVGRCVNDLLGPAAETVGGNLARA